MGGKETLGVVCKICSGLGPLITGLVAVISVGVIAPQWVKQKEYVATTCSVWSATAHELTCSSTTCPCTTASCCPAGKATTPCFSCTLELTYQDSSQQVVNTTMLYPFEMTVFGDPLYPGEMSGITDGCMAPRDFDCFYSRLDAKEVRPSIDVNNGLRLYLISSAVVFGLVIVLIVVVIVKSHLDSKKNPSASAATKKASQEPIVNHHVKAKEREAKEREAAAAAKAQEDKKQAGQESLLGGANTAPAASTDYKLWTDDGKSGAPAGAAQPAAI